MQITTKAQAKTIVSSLRREIKALKKDPATVSHNDCLTLMAKALGFSNWNTWEASLTAESVEPAITAPEEKSKYPLVNHGDFDFVRLGEDGKAFTGRNLWELDGTAEVILARASVNTVRRTGRGNNHSVHIEYDGETDIDWNSQITQQNAEGHLIWLDHNDDKSSGAQIVIAPEDCEDPAYDDSLPVRSKLVQAFLDYLTEQSVDTSRIAMELPDIQEIIGFCLTKKEEAELLKKLGKVD